MGKQKKKFIDKKNASTYHLMHRSQRDVADDIFDEMNGEEGAIPVSSSGMVLWPGENNLPETNKKVLFSNKANASTTTIPSSTRQEQQQSHDGDDGNSSQIIGNNNDPHSCMMEWRTKLEEAGLLDNEETSDKYLKPITGQGTFLDARSGRAVNLVPQQHQQQEHQNYEEDALFEVDRMFDSIPVTTDCMDPDIAALLFADEDVEGEENINIFDQYEELNDDFVFMAAQEPAEEEENDDAIMNNYQESDFNYDEHIRQLLEKSKREPTISTGNHHHPGLNDIEYFAQLNPIHNKQSRDDDDDEVDSWEDMNERQIINKKIHNQYENEEDDEMMTNATGIVPRLSPEEDRALCEKFEKALAEYDDDDDDEDYEEEPEDGFNDNHSRVVSDNMNQFNHRPLQGDPYIDAAIDEYLQEKKDDIYIRGLGSGNLLKKGGGSSFTALNGTTRIRGTDWIQNKNDIGKNTDDIKLNDNDIPIHILLENASIRLNEPIVRPPEEDVIFDGKSYYSLRQDNPWDCESILSTYSNLDNNPTVIKNSRRRNNRNNRNNRKNDNNNSTQTIINENDDNNDPIDQPIILSAKTGLPIGILDQQHQNENINNHNDDGDGDQSTIHTSISILHKRDKNETNDEKKIRKDIIKQQRSMARIQKKVSKDIYSELYQQKRGVVSSVHDDIAGKTVFRF